MRSLDNAKEIERRGGAVASGDWVTGSGRHVSRRAIPRYCIRVEVREAHTDWSGRWWPRSYRLIDEEGQTGDRVELRGYGAAAAARLLKSRPAVKRLVVLTDIRGYRRAIKSQA